MGDGEIHADDFGGIGLRPGCCRIDVVVDISSSHNRGNGGGAKDDVSMMVGGTTEAFCSAYGMTSTFVELLAG